MDYDKLKRRYNRVLNNNVKLRIQIVILFIALFAITTSFICFALITHHNKENYLARIDELEKLYKSSESQIVRDFGSFSSEKESLKIDYQNQLVDLETQLQAMTEISQELDNQNKQLVDLYNKNNQELRDLEKRQELYDKYQYAIINSEDGQRTDISYDDIVTLENLAAQKGMGKDAVDFLLAICMTESRGKANAKNSSSTASGLGQLLQSTAKMTYETLMGNGRGSYQQQYAFDHTTNLKMALYYIDYLAKENNRNVIAVCTAYAGGYDAAWIDKVDSYLQTKGKSIDTIKI